MALRCSLLAIGGALAAAAPAPAVPVDLSHATVLRHADRADTLGIAATMLATDLSSLGASGGTAGRRTDCGTVCIVIGRHDDPLIAGLARRGGIDLAPLDGAWERWMRATVHADGRTYLLIAGSDRRGAIYGTVDLSRALGISPWEWWADVTPRRRDRIAIDGDTVVSKAPSVKYRGIFLNDEDWGLEPWAAATLDVAKGNIGPNTYRRVFELMWRLKANTLWPAMHAVSAPFFGDPANAALAERYAIVIGTSHAEPMLRNNLREWDEAKRGPFDFTRRPQAIVDYWRERVATTGRQEDIYTLGLRGIHDGPMQGVTTTEGRRAVLEKVFGGQQDLLARTLGKPIAKIPQVFVAYHELQEAHDAGLKVPDDATLMWTDDNYGYLRRLSTPQEQRRRGGAGIYYHLSYWGRPHDYLWLGTTHPELIREEIGRAWDTDARRMWIVNVGDIKPIEYLTQYFLDLAFDADLLKTPSRDHLRRFMAEQFGEADADAIADVMMRFYTLAWERRPEFMGFGETEWVTPNRPSAYVQSDGEEAQARLAAHAALTAQAEAIAAHLPADRRDAFYELVLYPVRGAAKLNERILSLDLAGLYARQDRASANLYVDRARSAHAALVADTARYNALAGGKWRGIMDMAPRHLPVFLEPMWPHWAPSTQEGCGLASWGSWIGDENSLTFTQGVPATRKVALYGHQPQPIGWARMEIPGGLTLSRQAGRLDAGGGFEQRLTISYDGHGAVGATTIRCGTETLTLHATALAPIAAAPGVATEVERRVLMPATSGAAGADWERVDGPGSQHGVLRSRLSLPTRDASPSAGTPVTYHFATRTEAAGIAQVVALPTHPRDPAHGLRAWAGIDGGPGQVLDFATPGRSDRWRRNVLANTATASMPFPPMKAGMHQLRIVPLDPGVTLDRVEIVLDGARPLYGTGDVPAS